MPTARTVNFKSPVYNHFKAKNLKIGILHAGGPAPGGNLVLYGAALRARDHRVLGQNHDKGIQLLAFREGYSHLMSGTPDGIAKKWSFVVDREHTRYLRDQAALLPGSARDNPGKGIKSPEDMLDAEKTAPLTRVLDNLEAMGIGALVTVGGDDTMTTAAKLQLHFSSLVASGQRTYKSFLGVIHAPKTIDKDYPGIAFTFGFMTAAQSLGDEIKGLHDDAKASATSKQLVYHFGQIMGRKAGWLATATAIYGQATYTVIPEMYKDPAFGKVTAENAGKITIDQLASDVANVIISRMKVGKHYGTIAIAEGLADLLPEQDLDALNIGFDEHGHRRIGDVEIGRFVANSVKEKLAQEMPDMKAKLKAFELGYQSRQWTPNIFDVLLCQQLGVTAIDGIMQGKFGHMVTVKDVFDPGFVPFSDLVNPQTLRVKPWVMDPSSGLYTLMRAMEQPFATKIGEG